MRILLDENCDSSVTIEALQRNGHEVFYVSPDYKGLSDSDLLTICRQNQYDLFITFDADFANPPIDISPNIHPYFLFSDQLNPPPKIYILPVTFTR